jgi:hypothetical protein
VTLPADALNTITVSPVCLPDQLLAAEVEHIRATFEAAKARFGREDVDPPPAWAMYGTTLTVRLYMVINELGARGLPAPLFSDADAMAQQWPLPWFRPAVPATLDLLRQGQWAALLQSIDQHPDWTWTWPGFRPSSSSPPVPS